MSGGAKRSSLNQTRNRFFFRYQNRKSLDRFIHLSIHISYSKNGFLKLREAPNPWFGQERLHCFGPRKRREWARLLLLHTFFYPCPFRMRFARHWRFVLLLFFIGRFGWTSPFFPNSNWKGCLTSRCRFVFRPQWDGELVTPYFDFLASESRPGSRRSNNRRGAPQYTIARSNWESYYT